MRCNAGAGPDGPRMLAMLDAVAALVPSHTSRSEVSIGFEDCPLLGQFSTPNNRLPAGGLRRFLQGAA